MSKTAFLFPGQGAQFVGMGRDFYENSTAARAVFDQAVETLGPELLQIIFEGPEEKLALTEHTQPAILTVSSAIAAALAETGLTFQLTAGLSLGEYSALVAAKALSFKEALPLVRKRGLYMQDAVKPGDGKMVAIMGLSHEAVKEACSMAEIKGHVAPANYNCPGQIVISGEAAAVDEAILFSRDKGAKRISMLKVSAPFHCDLLKPVGSQMLAELEKINFNVPACPVYFNVSADSEDDPQIIKTNLVRQVYSPILWQYSVEKMIEAGATTFIGLGPGNSLTRLMKRINPQVESFSVEDYSGLKKLF